MIEIIKIKATDTEAEGDDVQTVEIELGEYEELIWRDSLFSMMLKGLFESASLSYSGNSLSFSASSIDQILRYGFPDSYKGTLAVLKEEKAKQDAEVERDEMITLVNLKDDEEDEKE